ncbi:MAG: hypothetical protein H7336_12555 [Bacteriovorax sp.]|nr:hypothetical protein [Bacteriovorax sp.]
MKNNTPLNFWNQVWQDGTIRFHQNVFNSQMVSKFRDVDLNGKTVLIPLAGKTRDILFFLEKGAQVTAVEFVEQAIIEFFENNEIQYTKIGNLYQCENLKFYAMDFFAFTTEKKFDVLFDRASQVVFAPAERPYYYQHMSTLIDTHTMLLLGAIEHTGPADFGPPHKISQAEVKNAYEKMGITLKKFSEQQDTTNEKLQAMGVNVMTSYYLTNQ